jgi:hypothetical protein
MVMGTHYPLTQWIFTHYGKGMVDLLKPWVSKW